MWNFDVLVAWNNCWKTAKLPVILDAMMLMYYHCNAVHLVSLFINEANKFGSLK